MPVSCIVRGCRSIRRSNDRKDSIIMYHGFPKDPKKRNVWLSTVPIKGKFYETAKICSLHFRKDDYAWSGFSNCVRLRKDAVPSFSGPLECPNQDEPTIFQSQSPEAAIKDNELFLTQDIVSQTTDCINVDTPLTINMRVCKICLCVGAKMYSINERNLDEMYQNILGMPPRLDDWLPQNICWECAARLNAADSFRTKAMLADSLLEEKSLNLSEILKLQQQHETFKPKLTKQRIFSINMSEKQKSTAQLLEGEKTTCQENSIELPKNDETEVEMNDEFNIDDIDEEFNELEEYNELVKENEEKELKKKEKKEESQMLTQLELLPKPRVVKVGTVPTLEIGPLPRKVKEIKVKKGSDINVFKGHNNNFGATVNMVAENIKESTSEKENDDEIILVVLADNKNIDAETSSFILEKIKENNQFSADGSRKPVVRLENINLPVTADSAPVQTQRHRWKNPTPIDERIFTVTPLKRDDLIKEVNNRQFSERYKNARYKCDVCYLGFQNQERQEKHLLKHSELRGAFECEICRFRMKSRLNLIKHMGSAHSTNFNCKLCPMVTRCRSIAVEHMRYHNGKKYECPICLVKFNKYTTLLNHKRLKHISDCVCELCGHTFVSQKGVRAHKQSQHNLIDENAELEGPYCKDCDVKFLSQRAYDKHLRLSSKHIKSEDDPIRISNDPGIKTLRSVRSVSTRRVRIRRPDENESPENSNDPVTCEQCGMELKDFRIYAAHFRKDHPGMNRTQFPPSKTSYMCEQCGKIFWSRTVLEGHMWVHTGQKGYQCEHCNKTFSQKSTLMNHLPKHDSASPRPAYTCHICGKQFGFHNNLLRHMFLHTGLKPYKCSVCDKCFASAAELKPHVNHVHLKHPRPKRVRRRVKTVAPSKLEE